MRRLVCTVVIGVALIMAFAAAPTALSAARLSDISGNWAEEQIIALVQQGVLGGYPDGTFRPNQTVTRAEFAKMAAKAFNLSETKKLPFQDVKDHWAAEAIGALYKADLMRGFDDQSFAPERSISRAEVTAVVMRFMGLDQLLAPNELDHLTFSDVEQTHWAAGAIDAADRLDILPPYFSGRFQPDAAATRAETAALLANTLRLRVVEGTIEDVNAAQMYLNAMSPDGTLHELSISPAVKVNRNTVSTDATALRKGDKVHVVSDRFSTPVYVIANGAATVAEVTNKVSDITRGLLTPEQLQAVIRGDLAAVASGFQVTLYNQLLHVGATPAEADSIMQKDWNSLTYHGQERLSQAMSNYLSLSKELTASLLNQDWNEAWKLAQVEVSQLVLSRLLFGGGAS
jgi:hypothetical protein